MAENEDRNVNFPPDTESGTTDEQDFGRSDRYANKDDEKNFNFTTTGDGTAWDSGRNSSIAHGTPAEEDLRSADAEVPGVSGSDRKDDQQ